MKGKSLKTVLLMFILIAVNFLSAFVPLFGKEQRAGAQENVQNSVKIISVTEQNREEVFSTRLSSDSEETYAPENRLWNGIPHIERTKTGRLWAAWESGGPNEPSDDNYILLSYSDDNGENWVDPVFIVDGVDENIRVFDVFLYTRTNGELIVYYYHNGKRWETTIENPDGKSGGITYRDTRVTSEDLKACLQEPVGLSDGTLCVVSQPGYRNKQLDFMVSKDDGLSWSVRGTMYSRAANKLISEAKTVQLSDGTLWVLARIDEGRGVERFVSDDNGFTWSESESELEYPLIGPGSRFNITKLKSGNLLFVTNDSTSSRTALTAFLSEDDGKSWQYSLLIDDRSDVAYPEITEDNEGYIYLIYDKGRAREKEVRLSIFNEEDIRTGAIVSEKGRNKIAVIKDKNYREIISVNADYGSYREVPVGTTKADVIADLPSSMTVVLEDGEKLNLSGEWKCLGYQSKKEGLYRFEFTPEEPLPDKVNDARSLLTLCVRVKAAEKAETAVSDGEGCGSAVDAALPGILTVSAIVFIRKKRNLIF